MCQGRRMALTQGHEGLDGQRCSYESTAKAKPAMIHKSPSANYAYAPVKGTAPHKQTGRTETDKAEATRSIMSSQLTKSNNMRGKKSIKRQKIYCC